MKLIRLLSFVALGMTCVFTGSAWGSVLKLNPSLETLEGVKLSQGALLQLGARAYPLVTAGTGLRSKKVVLLNVKVYVAQLLVSGSSAAVKGSPGDKALDLIAQMPAVAMVMTFIRDVDSGKIVSSFRDALETGSSDFRVDRGQGKSSSLPQ